MQIVYNFVAACRLLTSSSWPHATTEKCNLAMKYCFSVLNVLLKDIMFEAYLTNEAGQLEPDDIPQTNNPVWVLGKKYNAKQGEFPDQKARNTL